MPLIATFVHFGCYFGVLVLYDGPDALIERRKERTPLDNKTDNERVCLRQIQRIRMRLVGRKSIPTIRLNKPCKRDILKKEIVWRLRHDHTTI